MARRVLGKTTCCHGVRPPYDGRPKALFHSPQRLTDQGVAGKRFCRMTAQGQPPYTYDQMIFVPYEGPDERDPFIDVDLLAEYPSVLRPSVGGSEADHLDDLPYGTRRMR